MPQVYVEPAVKPSRRVRPISAPREASTRPRQTPKSTGYGNGSGPPLSILGQPSPSIADTCTTHNEMLFWVGWFARFHTDGQTYVPYELKTLDCPVVKADDSPMLHSNGQPQMMRCVREIARSEVGSTVEWTMISWNVGQVGMTFRKCATFADALAPFHGPPIPIRRT